jgi:hypothetical protein
MLKPTPMICNDCGERFPEWKEGGFSFARKKCPNCKSRNIEVAPKPRIVVPPMRQPANNMNINNENLNHLISFDNFTNEEFVFAKKSKEPKIEYRKDGRRYFKKNPGGKWAEISQKEYDNNVNENMLPRPYKKIKCLECGEEVCDNINYKIGHLYNRHNCKPSVGDYKAKVMLKKYFI